MSLTTIRRTAEIILFAGQSNNRGDADSHLRKSMHIVTRRILRSERLRLTRFCELVECPFVKSGNLCFRVLDY